MDLNGVIGFFKDEHLDSLLLLYVRHGRDVPEIKYIGLTEDAIEVIRSSFLKKIEKLNKRGKNFEKFDPEEFDPNAIHYLELENIPDDTLKIKELTAKDPSSICKDHKLFKREDIDKIKFILLRFRNSKGQTLGIFSKYKVKKYFKPDKMVKLLFIGDNLKPLGVKHDFGLDTEIELLFFEKHIIIFKRGRFLTAFNYIASYERRANEVFSYLKDPSNKDYIIRDIDQLSQAVAKKYGFEYFTKLNNIYSNEYYKNVTFEKIKEIRRNHGLNLTINGTPKEITFSDPDEFVRLYNRDYQTDDIDGAKWITYRKRRSK